MSRQSYASPCETAWARRATCAERTCRALLLLAAAVACSTVEAQSISTGGSAQSQPQLNTLNACAEGKYMNGGPATPLYDYADSGDDWTGACIAGKHQSPVDLPDANSTLQTLPAQHSLRFGTITASNNAVLRLEVEEVELLSESWLVQGFQVPVCGGADVGCLSSPANSTVQYVQPAIVNLHFHANSEHTRLGEYYAGEAHLVLNVTVNSTSTLVVVGVWMDIYGDPQPNSLLASLQPYMNQSVGADCTPVPDNVTFAVDSLFPANKEYYSYSGSLTTPPCTEGVVWVVFVQPIKMSQEQLKLLYKANAHIYQPCAAGTSRALCNILGSRTNNRPLNALNGRTVFIGGTASA